METHADSDGFLRGSSYWNTLQAGTGAATSPSSMVWFSSVQPGPPAVPPFSAVTVQLKLLLLLLLVLNAGGNQFVRHVSATLIE